MKIKYAFLPAMAMFFILFYSSDISAQDDTLIFPDDYKQNVIKWNLTPFILWSSKNINISYERVLKPHRTFSVNAGYFELPSFGTYDSLKIDAARNKGGFSVSGDYRFYFKNRNTRPAPDGLYWGPYASWHHYGFTNDFTVKESSTVSGQLSFDGYFNALSVGLQLGYQFVIKDRFTVDLIFMGPSASLYTAKLTLDGNVDPNLEDEYLEAIRDVLISKFPFLDDLINTGEFNASGVTTGLGPNLRYMIQIGYRF